MTFPLARPDLRSQGAEDPKSGAARVSHGGTDRTLVGCLQKPCVSSPGPRSLSTPSSSRPCSGSVLPAPWATRCPSLGRISSPWGAHPPAKPLGKGRSSFTAVSLGRRPPARLVRKGRKRGQPGTKPPAPSRLRSCSGAGPARRWRASLSAPVPSVGHRLPEAAAGRPPV